VKLNILDTTGSSKKGVTMELKMDRRLKERKERPQKREEDRRRRKKIHRNVIKQGNTASHTVGLVTNESYYVRKT